VPLSLEPTPNSGVARALGVGVNWHTRSTRSVAFRSNFISSKTISIPCTRLGKNRQPIERRRSSSLRFPYISGKEFPSETTGVGQSVSGIVKGVYDDLDPYTYRILVTASIELPNEPREVWGDDEQGHNRPRNECVFSPVSTVKSRCCVDGKG
jgi:hypothetical protein